MSFPPHKKFVDIPSPPLFFVGLFLSGLARARSTPLSCFCMIFDPLTSRWCQAVIISRESCHCCRWSCLSGPLPWLKSRLLIFSTININKVKKFWKIFTLLTWESYKILQRTNRSTPAMHTGRNWFHILSYVVTQMQNFAKFSKDIDLETGSHALET